MFWFVEEMLNYCVLVCGRDVGLLCLSNLKRCFIPTVFWFRKRFELLCSTRWFVEEILDYCVYTWFVEEILDYFVSVWRRNIRLAQNEKLE